MDKTSHRLRRARRTRVKIAELKEKRMSVHRTNAHIYVQIFSDSGREVLISASTLEVEVRSSGAFKGGGNKDAATIVGKRIAEKAKKIGVTRVAFDRSGYKYHGRVKALADAAREGGLIF